MKLESEILTGKTFNPAGHRYSKLISKGYLAAGICNISGIIFAVLTAPREIGELYPEVFSKFGMLAIILWGLAYIAVHRQWQTPARPRRSLRD